MEDKKEATRMEAEVEFEKERLNTAEKLQQGAEVLKFSDKGRYFNTYIIGDHLVIKSPRSTRTEKRISDIASRQNYLAERIEGILPTKPVIHRDSEDRIIGACLLQYRAPGKRADNYSYSLWKPEKERIEQEMYKEGYEMGDAAPADFYYDEKNQRAYYLDFSSVEYKGEGKEPWET